MAKKRTDHNTITDDIIEPHIRRIEELTVKLDSEKEASKMRSRAIKDEIKLVYEEASADGVSCKAFQASMKKAGLVRKINAIDLALEDDTREASHQISSVIEGLEGLPLGDAALQREAAERNSTPTLSAIEAMSL